MPELAKKKCTPCQGDEPPLTAEQIEPLVSQVKGWNVIENHHIKKGFDFPDFKSALDFVNRIGQIAESENHHPDILLKYGKVEVTSWTHKINGLSENDFILAAKIDEARKGQQAVGAR